MNMELSHLSDMELINHVIKHDTDPVRLRLATYMERIKGAIIDDLEDAGMDPTYCTFTTEWGSERLPGQYIMHLEEELQIRDDNIHELSTELEQQKARTIADLIQELNQDIQAMKHNVKCADIERRAAETERDIAKDKLSMWAKLNGQV